MPDGTSPELEKIKWGINDLRARFNLSPNQFTTFVLPNKKTKGNSGTGAWNTAIEYAYKNSPDGFLCILDDDDEYLPNHLNDCLSVIMKNPKLCAVFQRIDWKMIDGSILSHTLTKDQLTPQHFFRGNPGIQGSNMFFKTMSLIQIGGFDETFPNTTDRELMIRFLKHVEPDNISVIETVGIIHHYHKAEKVSNDLLKKQIGLEMFYRKFRGDFSRKDFELSLERARRFFNFKYPSTTYE
jgi:hypothetical protein